MTFHQLTHTHKALGTKVTSAVFKIISSKNFLFSQLQLQSSEYFAQFIDSTIQFQ